MARIRVVIVGFGRLGRQCAQLIAESPELELTGVWRREASRTLPLPAGLRHVPVAGHISELGRAEAALVCVPTEQALSVITELAQHRVPVVECATLDHAALEHYYARIDTLARQHRSQDPYAFSARAMLDAARRLPYARRGLQRYCG